MKLEQIPTRLKTQLELEGQDLVRQGTKELPHNLGMNPTHSPDTHSRTLSLKADPSCILGPQATMKQGCPHKGVVPG